MKIAHMGDKEQSAGVRGNSQAQWTSLPFWLFLPFQHLSGTCGSLDGALSKQPAS